ncbi:MAG: TlpA family protein disulfide reductase [Chloroflexi bacterium]|nr:TlpA family protein disulfide reductase [Chloroflexota bacterium]
MRQLPYTFYLLISVLLLGLAGCGGSVGPAAAGHSKSQNLSAGRTNIAASTGSIGASKPLPNVRLATLDGGSFALAEHSGEPTAIFFMAYWCSSCLLEARAWARLKTEYPNMDVLVVDLDPTSTLQTLGQFREMAGDTGLVWAFDSQGSLARALGVQSLDATVIFNRKGQVIYQDAVPTAYTKLKSVMEALRP